MARRFTRASSHYLRSSGADLGTVLGDSWTIAAWFRVVDVGTSTGRLGVYIGDPATNNEYIGIGVNNGNTAVLKCSSASEFIMMGSGFLFTEGEVQHVCGVQRTSTDRDIYVNGDDWNLNTDTYTMPSGMTRFSVGALDRSSQTDYFDGDIGYVGVWDVDLTEAEVQALAGSTNGDTLGVGLLPWQVRPENLVIYAPLGIGSPDPELIGGYDLTVSGATAVDMFALRRGIFVPARSASPAPGIGITAGALAGVYTGTTVSPTIPSHVSGNVLIVEALHNGSAALTLSGWTEIYAEENANASTAAWYKTAASGSETATVTSDLAASASAGLFAEAFVVTGAANVIDATTNGSPTSSTTPTGATITTTEDEAVAITSALIDDATAFSSGLPPSGWTEVADESATNTTAPTVAAVSSSLVAETGNTSTMTVTLPAHQTDDILLVQALQGTSSTLTCATSGWTKIDGTADGTMSTGWFWKRAASASETDPVIDTTSNFTNPASGYGAVMVIRGAVASGTPYESATKSTIDTSATLTTAALTTTGTYRLGITFTAVEDNNDVTTTPTGWADELEITSITGSDALAYGASQSIPAATTVGAETFSMSASDRHQSLSLAFIPASGTGARITTISKVIASAGDVTGVTVGTLAGAEYWKTLALSLQVTAGGTTYAKAGSATLSGEASGARVTDRPRTGSAVLTGEASAADAREAVETGLAVLSAEAGGTNTVPKTYAKAGSAVLTGIASGADSREAVESGAASLSGVASGASVEYRIIARTGFAQIGSTEPVFSKQGKVVLSGAASGVDAAEMNRSVTFELSAGASATDSAEHVEAGTGVLTASASGTDVAEHVEAGSSVLSQIASGTDAAERVESGLAVAGLTATGADSHEYAKTGTATLTATTSAPDAREAVEAGAATLGLTASGADSHEAVEAGRAVVGLEVSGSSVGGTTYSKAGSATLTATASAADAREAVESGAARLTATASAADAREAVEAGTATLTMVGSGVSLEGITYAKAGSATLSATASASDVHEAVEAGTAVLTVATSGPDVHEAVEAGVAVVSGVASGASVEEQVVGTTYEKAGVAVLRASAAGSSAEGIIYTKAGSAALLGAVSAADAAEYVEVGTASLTGSASGADAAEYVEAGLAVLNAIANGLDASVFVEAGTVSLGVILSGAGTESQFEAWSYGGTAPGTASYGGTGDWTYGGTAPDVFTYSGASA